MEASDRPLLSRAQRVCGYAAMLAAPLKLDQAAQHDLAIGAFLHDVGCVAMECGEDSPEHVRERPAADDPLHAALGARMAAAAGAPDHALQAIAHHHERHDGSGYPDGLAGKRIPLPARIVAVAQAFDRLTAASGRAAMPFAEACEHLGGQAGTALDPGLVELFLECLNEREPSRPARTGA
jgi:HD-GYP domain-containing protein (c-di-GMP phosphodiesterase class II)